MQERLIGKQIESCILGALQARSEEHLKHHDRCLLFEQLLFLPKKKPIGNWRRLVRQEKRFTQLLDVRYPQWYELYGCLRRVSDPVDPEFLFAFHLTRQMSFDEKSSRCLRHPLQ